MYLSKKKKIVFFNLGAVAAAALIGVAIWQLTQCKPEVKEYSKEIVRENHTPDGFLRRPGDSIKLFVENLNGEQVTWEYNEVDNDNIEYIPDTTDNSLTISVKEDSGIITVEDKITVIAKSGEEILDEIDLFVGSVEPLIVPLDNADIFNFTSTNTPGDTITGFSDKVKNDPSILVKNYNGLDFSGQEKVKYISGDCQFNVDTVVENDDVPKKIFDLWKPFELNFGKLTFLPNGTTGKTGFHLLYNADLNSLNTLDFGESNWAPEGTSYSAANVFEEANLSGVMKLELKKAMFASAKMTGGGSGFSKELSTAYETFYRADLSSLVSLDLSDTKFAVENMNVAGSLIYTGYSTFRYCEFDSLEELNLENTVFAAEGMGGGSITTANNTFKFGVFSSLETLNLENTVFAAEGMESTNTINTASETFFHGVFSSLEELNLENTVFSAEGMEASWINTANYTFQYCDFSSLEILNLENTKFADTAASYGFFRTALGTFCQCMFDSLANLNLKNTKFAGERMVSGGIKTGDNTFASSKFYSLEKLNLENTKFANEGITGDDIQTACFTFLNSEFSKLESIDLRKTVFYAEDMNDSAKLASRMFCGTSFQETFRDLYLPQKYDGENGSWDETFENDAGMEFSSLFVHGYKEQPAWFIGSELTNSTWVNNIPITEDFFNLTSSEDDPNLYVVNGFSDDVISTPSLLEPYNVMDFTDNPTVKFVSASCNFGGLFNYQKTPMIKFWERLCKLNFNGLHFLSSGDFRTGFIFFYQYAFNSLVELNLSNTVWADTKTKHSASRTFDGAEFPTLITLDLSNAIFAVEGMESDDNIRTADETFSACTFPFLKELNLENVIFAAKEMVGDEDSGTLYSAFQTFYKCNFGSLEKLNLRNTIFAADDMQSNDVSTAVSTFQGCEFDQLKELVLENTVFAGKWTKCSVTNTAWTTFYGCHFLLLEKLNLESTVFAVEEMVDIDSTSANIAIAARSFEESRFGNSFSSIILPAYNMDLGRWIATFSDHDSSTVKIYGYISCPTDWFNNNWWLGAHWYESYPTAQE